MLKRSEGLFIAIKHHINFVYTIHTHTSRIDGNPNMPTFVIAFCQNVIDFFSCAIHYIRKLPVCGVESTWEINVINWPQNISIELNFAFFPGLGNTFTPISISCAQTMGLRFFVAGFLGIVCSIHLERRAAENSNFIVRGKLTQLESRKTGGKIFQRRPKEK